MFYNLLPPPNMFFTCPRLSLRLPHHLGVRGTVFVSSSIRGTNTFPLWTSSMPSPRRVKGNLTPAGYSLPA
jgi:hypothetical protein